VLTDEDDVSQPLLVVADGALSDREIESSRHLLVQKNPELKEWLKQKIICPGVFFRRRLPLLVE